MFLFSNGYILLLGFDDLVGRGPTLVCLLAGHSVVFSWCALWFLTSPCVCWLCSTSLPGGHQVDGLPPAPSMIVDGV